MAEADETNRAPAARLPNVRWPPPTERAFLTAQDALHWIGWGELHPDNGVPNLEAHILGTYGTAKRIDDLIIAFETGCVDNRRLFITPEQVRDNISRREGWPVTFAEVLERLKEDRAKLGKAYALLEIASAALVKACVDGDMLVVGQREGESARVIPADVFMQCGIRITCWGKITLDRATLWDDVRFRYQDVLRLWPPLPPPDAKPIAVQAADPIVRKGHGGRPTNRDLIIAALEKLKAEKHRVHDMPPGQLAKLVADRCGVKLNNSGWALRTVEGHIQKWRADPEN